MTAITAHCTLRWDRVAALSASSSSFSGKVLPKHSHFSTTSVHLLFPFFVPASPPPPPPPPYAQGFTCIIGGQGGIDRLLNPSCDSDTDRSSHLALARLLQLCFDVVVNSSEDMSRYTDSLSLTIASLLDFEWANIDDNRVSLVQKFVKKMWLRKACMSSWKPSNMVVFIENQERGRRKGTKNEINPQVKWLLGEATHYAHGHFKQGGSLAPLLAGATAGSFTGGTLADKLGRTKTFQLDAMPLAIGAFLCATAQNMQTMLIGRVLAGIGIGIGISSAIARLHISEELLLHPL